MIPLEQSARTLATLAALGLGLALASPAAAQSADAPGGVAAVYNTRMQGRTTACNERYDRNALTAAHNTLPCGTRIRVTGEKSKKSVVVRINDRGPTTPGRVLDLSSAAAHKLGMSKPGLMKVDIAVLSQPKPKAAKGKG